MGRNVRRHLPGAYFHLTARLQNREPLLDEHLRTEVVASIEAAARRSDAALVAYAVMPNHLHLVVRQGRSRLGRLMQPLLRRIALTVQRYTGRTGHVFGERFRDLPCLSPEHLRNTIVYTHLNPVRPRLCAHPGDYPWTSHGQYSGAGSGPVDPSRIMQMLELFRTEPDGDLERLREDYLAAMRYRIAADAHGAAVKAGMRVGAPPASPDWRYGDAYGVRCLGIVPVPIPPDRSLTVDPEAPPPDLLDIARSVLSAFDDDLDLDKVRSRFGGRGSDEVMARRAFALRAAEFGYTGVQIAAFLRVSPSAVSRLLAASRQPRPVPIAALTPSVASAAKGPPTETAVVAPALEPERLVTAVA